MDLRAGNLGFPFALMPQEAGMLPERRLKVSEMLCSEVMPPFVPQDDGRVPWNKLWSRCSPCRNGHACTPPVVFILQSNIEGSFRICGQHW